MAKFYQQPRIFFAEINFMRRSKCSFQFQRWCIEFVSSLAEFHSVTSTVKWWYRCTSARQDRIILKYAIAFCPISYLCQRENHDLTGKTMIYEVRPKNMV